MAIGQRNSYGTDAPISPNYLGDALAQVDNMEFRNRQEKLAKDKAKKDEEEAKLKEYALYDSKLKSDYTNVNNIDSKINDYLYSQKEQSAQANKILSNPNSTREQKIQAMSLKNGILNNIDQLDQAVKFFNTNNKNLEEGVRAGKYDQSSLDNMQKVLGAIGQGDVRFGNKNGVLTVSAYERSADGTPTKVIADSEPLGEFVRNHLTPDLKSNLEEQIAKYHTEYPASSTKTTDANGTTIFHKGIDPTKGSKDWNNATEKAVGILSNEPELKRASKKYNLPITDVEGIASKLRDDLLNGVPTQDENIKDASLIWQKNKDAKDRAEKVVQATNARIDDDIVDQLMTTANEKGQGKGTVVNKVSKNSLYRNAVAFPKLPFKNLGGEESGLNSGFIEVVTKEKGSGKFIVKGKALKTKGEKFKLGDKTVDYFGLQEEANNGNEEAQLALSSYGKGDNYSTFIRTVGEDELAPLIGQTSIKTIDNLSNRLEKMNPNANKSVAKPQYTNITETQKGTIGVKDGKWYDIKTGKEIK